MIFSLNFPFNLEFFIWACTIYILAPKTNYHY